MDSDGYKMGCNGVQNGARDGKTVKMRGVHVITTESYCSGTIVCYLVQDQGTLAERGPHLFGSTDRIGSREHGTTTKERR